MASSNASPVRSGDDIHESFYKIDGSNTTPLSLLLKIMQTNKCLLPIRVLTDRSVMELIKKAMEYAPIAVTLLNDMDSVVEFKKGVKITEVAQLMHSIDSWVGYKVEVGCIMATKKQSVKTAKDIKDHRRAARDLEQKQQQFEEEQQASKIQIKDLLDKFEEQMKHIEVASSQSTVGPVPVDVLTPQCSETGEVNPSSQTSSIKLPPLPKFSGALPVPKGEGSFGQFMFQICGFKSSYTEEAMKNSIVGTVTDGA